MGIFNWGGKGGEDKLQLKKLGLALSGGSARGLAHIGILRALEEASIVPDIISGTSMGALVGVLYAAGLSPNQIKDTVNKEPLLKMVRPAWGQHGLFKVGELRKVLEKHIPKDDFGSLKTPFYVAVSNINKGHKEIISEGSLFDYVLASCAVPVIFAPMVINGTTYIDGALYDNLPADAIRPLCKTLIGIHVNYIGEQKQFTSIIDVAGRTFSLSIGKNVRAAMESCDYLIDPPAITDFSLWDYDKADAIIETGYSFTKEWLEQHSSLLSDISNR